MAWPRPRGRGVLATARARVIPTPDCDTNYATSGARVKLGRCVGDGNLCRIGTFQTCTEQSREKCMQPLQKWNSRAGNIGGSQCTSKCPAAPGGRGTGNSHVGTSSLFRRRCGAATGTGCAEHRHQVRHCAPTGSRHTLSPCARRWALCQMRGHQLANDDFRVQESFSCVQN